MSDLSNKIERMCKKIHPETRLHFHDESGRLAIDTVPPLKRVTEFLPALTAENEFTVLASIPEISRRVAEQANA